MYNTGNKIPSAKLEDMADNANVLDQMVNKTEGNVIDRTGLSRRVFQQIIMDMGFEPLAGTFQTGATLTQRNQVLQDGTTGVFYSWNGVLPKVVSAGSTPATSGGIGASAWVDRTDLTLRGELKSEYGADLITHKTQSANFVSMTIAELQDLAPIYPEQLGAVAYGYDVTAADMIVDSSSALSNAFSAAVVLGRKVVLTGRYRVNNSIVSHYIQYANTSLVVEGQTAWSALVFTSSTDRIMIEIHGYRPILRNFRCENTPSITGWDTKTAIKITGREGLIDSVWFRGGWKEEIWGVDFSESLISNTNGENDPFPRDGKTDNVGIGLRLNSCINLNVINSFHGYNNYVYRMGYYEEGETLDNIKPSSYNETITWSCEGIEFIGLRSLRSMYGIEPSATEVSHSNCIIDLNKYKIATIKGVATKFTDCWLATDTDTPSGSIVWSAEPTASQVSVQSCTFDAKDGINPKVEFNSAIQNIVSNRFIKTRSEVTSTLFQYIAGNIPISTDDIIIPTIPVGQTSYFYAQTLFSTTNPASLRVGAGVPTSTNGVLAVRAENQYNRAFVFYGGDGEPSMWGHYGNTASTGTPSSMNAKLYVTQDPFSGRSINASGTINASGADYAEYMRKSNGCGEIKKGQIVGINPFGELTDKFSESISFCIKSTSPNLVGNDSWSSKFKLPEFNPTKPNPVTPEDIALYSAELEKFTTDYSDAQAELDSERANWDRIAFCGQVPIKVDGAVAGDYVIPVPLDNDVIGYEVTKNPSLEQYLSSVGKMLNAETIIVKV